MAVTGNLDRWATQFPDSLVPEIIRLVLSSWTEFSTNETWEVLITQEFFVVLRRNQEFSKLPFLIDLEITLLNQSGTGQQGRLDLRFIAGHLGSVYYSIECKRLRVNFDSGFNTLANEYVTAGMFRYFNGQYATDLDKGGMLGYVMDGDVEAAIDDVRQAIESRRGELNMSANETLHQPTIFPEQVKETIHNYGPSGQFTTYHIFLPINTLNNSAVA